MKHIVRIQLALLLCLPGLYAQKDYEQYKKPYFKYDTSVIRLMRDNWCMYFREDVACVLDTSSKRYMFEIKMDSYGCLYPDMKILDAIRKTDFQDQVDNYAALETHSFHRLLAADPGARIDSTIKTMPAGEKKIYEGLQKLSRKSETEDDYYKAWNAYHDSLLIARLKKMIEEGKKTRIVFFIHGFNVPYSLAALQAITLYKLARDSAKAIGDETLFVPVYWPSNDAKFKDLSQETFNTLNIPEYKRNGRLYFYYTNRCYYAAITLRKIINALDTKLKIDIIAHSLGTTIATTCLINTVSKFDYGMAWKVKNHNKIKDTAWIRKHNVRSWNSLTMDLLKTFYSVKLPDRPVNVFLSAAAIPGVNTFADVVPSVMKNKQFYVTINQYDEMVSKDNIRGKVKGLSGIDLKYINASRLSATTLGCNYKCEAYNTQKLYTDSVGKDLFKLRVVSEETDHDIFTYIQQKEYIKFFVEFLEGK